MVEKLFLFIHHLGCAGLLSFGDVLILSRLGKLNEEKNRCVSLENLKFDDFLGFFEVEMLTKKMYLGMVRLFIYDVTIMCHCYVTLIKWKCENYSWWILSFIKNFTERIWEERNFIFRNFMNFFQHSRIFRFFSTWLNCTYLKTSCKREPKKIL